MKPPKFIIASTGRSGSRYIAQVLTKAGIRCGHEEWFTSPALNRTRKGGLVGDSSCFSVPHLSDYDGIIFHQVRNPLHVLTSLYENRKRIKSAGKIWKFRRRFIAQQTGDIMRDFMQMIVGMNEEIEKYAIHTWDVEQVYEAHIGMVSVLAGTRYNESKATKALSEVPKTTNSHHDAEYLSWDDIEDCKEKEMLMKQAGEYGYEN